MSSQKTKAIFLEKTKLPNGRNIVRFFTQCKGSISFLTYDTPKIKNKTKLNLFSLSLVNISFDFMEKKEIQTPHEITAENYFSESAFSINKQAQVFFVAEVLKNTLRNESQNTELFSYLENTISGLFTEEYSPEFHLHFLHDLSGYLGFRSQTEVFSNGIDPAKLAVFNDDEYLGGRKSRNETLEYLLGQYKDHIPGFQLKSLDVLKEVLT